MTPAVEKTFSDIASITLGFSALVLVVYAAREMAARKGQSPALWGVLTVFLMPVFLVLCLVRARNAPRLTRRERIVQWSATAVASIMAALAAYGIAAKPRAFPVPSCSDPAVLKAVDEAFARCDCLALSLRFMSLTDLNEIRIGEGRKLCTALAHLSDGSARQASFTLGLAGNVWTPGNTQLSQGALATGH